MKAWQLIEKEENWCKGYTALNSSGKFVYPESPDAVKWCAIGAITKCYSTQEGYIRVMENLQRLVGNRYMNDWNDTSTHAEIIAALQAAESPETPLPHS